MVQDSSENPNFPSKLISESRIVQRNEELTEAQRKYVKQQKVFSTKSGAFSTDSIRG